MSEKPPIIDYAGPRPPPMPMDYASTAPKLPQAIRPPGPAFGVLLVILLVVIGLIAVVLLFAVK